jgi:hypothetical protein
VVVLNFCGLGLRTYFLSLFFALACFRCSSDISILAIYPVEKLAATSNVQTVIGQCRITILEFRCHF